jgi:hypothetical protein
MQSFVKFLALSPLGAVLLRETTMTRIIVFALNVMLFGVAAVLMVKAPPANLGERRQPEQSGVENAGAIPNFV